ncbi:hypothetical protein V8C26DRAFT_412572 [Trichoderma gracile]
MVWPRATAASIRHGMNGVWRMAGLGELSSVCGLFLAFSRPFSGLYLVRSISRHYDGTCLFLSFSFTFVPSIGISVYGGRAVE